MEAERHVAGPLGRFRRCQRGVTKLHLDGRCSLGEAFVSDRMAGNHSGGPDAQRAPKCLLDFLPVDTL